MHHLIVISEKRHLGVLPTPNVEATVSSYLSPRETFEVSEKLVDLCEGRTYFRLSDGRGWVSECSRKDPNSVVVADVHSTLPSRKRTAQGCAVTQSQELGGACKDEKAGAAARTETAIVPWKEMNEGTCREQSSGSKYAKKALQKARRRVMLLNRRIYQGLEVHVPPPRQRTVGGLDHGVIIQVAFRPDKKCARGFGLHSSFFFADGKRFCGTGAKRRALEAEPKRAPHIRKLNERIQRDLLRDWERWNTWDESRQQWCCRPEGALPMFSVTPSARRRKQRQPQPHGSKVVSGSINKVSQSCNGDSRPVPLSNGGFEPKENPLIPSRADGVGVLALEDGSPTAGELRGRAWLQILRDKAQKMRCSEWGNNDSFSLVPSKAS